MTMANPRQDRSVLELMAELMNQFTALLRAEGQLVRAEMSEKLGQVGTGMGFIVGGAILTMPALVILLHAAVAALEEAGFEPQSAALMVGGGVLVLGLIFMIAGFNALKVRKLVPKRTIHQLQEDAAVARQQVRQGNDYQRAA
jgi:hypothetical protein